MSTNKHWQWIPSLYFAQGLPYVLVMSLSVVLYKRMGVSNAEIAFYTSWLYLPWVVKPLWSPAVEAVSSPRKWVVATQAVLGLSALLVAFLLGYEGFLFPTLCAFWLMAVVSATHDIAADGFYLSALSAEQQSFFVGIRSTFYRFAMIAGQGGLIALAGYLEQSTQDIPLSWGITLAAAGGLLLLLGAYHRRSLPAPEKTSAALQPRLQTIRMTFSSFFRKENLASSLAFFLLYRLGEAQLVKILPAFLIDTKQAGGLALSTEAVGLAYGTVGVGALVAGGILGGVAIARKGLRHWLWYMVLALNLPNVLYVLLAYTQYSYLPAVTACIAIEQFGYGFGFSAFLVYMMRFAEGQYPTAHYAICTAFMALGMMLPGMWSGALQELVGYQYFFVAVLASALPILWVIGRVKL